MSGWPFEFEYFPKSPKNLGEFLGDHGENTACCMKTCRVLRGLITCFGSELPLCGCRQAVCTRTQCQELKGDGCSMRVLKEDVIRIVPYPHPKQLILPTQPIDMFNTTAEDTRGGRTGQLFVLVERERESIQSHQNENRKSF